MEDLISNANTLFDESLSPSPQSSALAGARNSIISYSSLFESSPYAEPHVVDPEVSTSARSSSSMFPSDTSMDLSRPRTLPPNLFLNPVMGLSPPQTPMNGRYSSGSEQVIPDGEDSSTVMVLPHTSPPLTSATKQQLSQELPFLQVSTIPHIPPKSPSSSSAFHPASSTTSLQTEMESFPSAV